MKTYLLRLVLGSAIITFAILSDTAFAQSRDAEFEEMKAMMKEMAKTIRTLQAEVAELKKEKVAGKQEARPAKSLPRRKPRDLPLPTYL